MIILYCILSGGLGNQMFQYAAARSYQISNDTQLCLCTFVFDRGINRNRFYSLGNCQLNKDITLASSVEYSSIEKRYFKFIEKFPIWEIMHLPQFIRKISTWIVCKRGYVHLFSSPFDYMVLTISHNKDSILWGGFQSHKYFQKYESIIRKELRIKEEPNPQNAQMLKKIMSCESVCVHIRRGDYKEKNFMHLDNCNEEYYIKAMQVILQKLENPVFFIFSNSHEDIEWVKDNYSLPGQIVFVDNHNEDYQELQLMYSCCHFIIANSTFSWWAQYLSFNQKKIVCAPSQWDKSCKKESRNIYDDKWIIIDTERAE